MKIDRIEVRVTNLTGRLTRMRSTGVYDTGAPGALLGKPVLVTIFAGGVAGHGQIRPLAPHHSLADNHASMIAMIAEICGPRMIGRSIFDLEFFHALFDRLSPGNFAARAALDIALHDAIGKATGQPVYNLIGGLAQDTVPLEWSISMADDPARMVADAQEAIGRWGIRVLCIKAGHPQGWRHDVSNFEAVRAAVGDEIIVGMDANTGWSVADSITVMRALRDARLDYLEQPVARRDLAGLAAVRRAADGVPVMADEACSTIEDAHDIVAHEAADVLCIKLYKHGGITPARKIAAVAEAANLRINCGGLAVMSQLEAAAGVHFYASRPAARVMPAGEFIFGLGVGGNDPLVGGDTGFRIEDGAVRPPFGPGLGVTLDPAAVEALTLHKVSIP